MIQAISLNSINSFIGIIPLLGHFVHFFLSPFVQLLLLRILVFFLVQLQALNHELFLKLLELLFRFLSIGDCYIKLANAIVVNTLQLILSFYTLLVFYLKLLVYRGPLYLPLSNYIVSQANSLFCWTLHQYRFWNSIIKESYAYY